MNVTENAPRFVLFDGCKELDVERVWAKERCSVRQEEIGRGLFAFFDGAGEWENEMRVVSRTKVAGVSGGDQCSRQW